MRRTVSGGEWSVWTKCLTWRNSSMTSKTSETHTDLFKVCFKFEEKAQTTICTGVCNNFGQVVSRAAQSSEHQAGRGGGWPCCRIS